MQTAAPRQCCFNTYARVEAEGQPGGFSYTDPLASLGDRVL